MYTQRSTRSATRARSSFHSSGEPSRERPPPRSATSPSSLSSRASGRSQTSICEAKSRYDHPSEVQRSSGKHKRHGIFDELAEADVKGCRDKVCQGAGRPVREPFRGRWLKRCKRRHHSTHAKIRCLGEQAMATLKGWAPSAEAPPQHQPDQ